MCSLIAYKDEKRAGAYYFLSCIGSLSLFPLLFEQQGMSTLFSELLMWNNNAFFFIHHQLMIFIQMNGI